MINSGQPKHTTSWWQMLLIVVIATATGMTIWYAAQQTIEQSVQVASAPQPVIPTKSTAVPQIATQTVLSGRDHVWDMAFLPSGDMLFTERKGDLSVIKGGKASLITHFADVYAVGEGGLLGLIIDPNFAQNRYIYACMDSKLGGPDVRVMRLQLRADGSDVDNRKDIITGIPANSSTFPGRHSGCRVAWGPDGALWVGTGDTAQGDMAIQPKKLGGKILRVDRDGNPAPGNLGGQFDPRIYSYGHRNVQGLAFFAKAQNGVLGVNIEHGSDIDDEVNLLTPGNFGWAPGPSGYNETGVPMTDTKRFADAKLPIWNSGSPTQAPSGATVIKGTQWKGWDGALAVAVLKAHHLKILQLNVAKNAVTREDQALDNFGRLRAITEGSDGNLYISTDNGGSDQIIRVIPH